jgi:hypothetical protein
MNTHSNPTVDDGDYNVSCASELWRAMTSCASQCYQGISSCFSGIGSFIASGVSAVWNCLTKGLGYLWGGMKWIWNQVLYPFAVSGVNVVGYLLDKVFFGSPGLRSSLEGGLATTGIPDAMRQSIKENSGWDIYETLGEWPGNIFGLLGAGFGIFNILNHLITSAYFNIRNYFNIFGSYGVYGEKTSVEDKRNPYVKALFGLLSLPIVIPVVAFTNIFSAACAFGKNFWISYWYNTSSTYNLLGSDGVLGERQPYKDNDRSFITRLFFGTISFPLVFGTAFVTNLFDAACTIIKHTAISFWHNIRCSFNLLGEYGIFGARLTYEDKREMPAKIGFGILSAVFVVIPAMLTNALDIACTVIKHTALSFWYNLRCSFNLLGENGIFGARLAYEDTRDMPAKIGFGILSAVFVAIPAMLTNALDITCTVIKHTALSFWHNLRCSFNLLGENGIFGARLAYEDTRDMPAKIGFGILSAVFVAIPAVLTNTLDFACTVIKHTAISFWNNLRCTFNLLGDYGIAGPRLPYEDNRELPAKVGFGILSGFLVIPAAIISNSIIAIATAFRNFSLSFWRNFSFTYNLLGSNGLMGKRQDYQDDRSLLTRSVFGVLSSPFVFTASLCTNIFNVVITSGMHLLTSWVRNLRSVYNLLGKDGVFGERKAYEDDRTPALRYIFGALSSFLVVVPALITNAFDVLCTGIKHTAISWWQNLRCVFNLLGEEGIFGKRLEYKDDRSLPTKIGFGLVSAVFVAMPAFLTNMLDIACTGIKHTAISFWRNLRCVFNLLGEDGIFGPRLEYSDNRSMSAKIIFGTTSAIFVAIPALLTNVIDIACTMIKHTAISFWQNIRCSFNLLGENGIFGARLKYEDNRGIPAKIGFGIISSPFVALAALTTNVFDIACTGIMHTAISFWHNLRCTFNLLGENGVFGVRLNYEDKRDAPAKIVFGITSALFVAIPAVITNAIDITLSFFKNFMLSFGNNLSPIYNLLGENGVMGPRNVYDDKRGKLAIGFFGILSAPFVALAALATNFIDLSCTIIKNWRKTLLMPAAAIFGIALAPVCFAVRKLLKGLYDCTIGPCISRKPVSGWRMLRGALNVMTLGGASIVIKLAKGLTGYTHRFGFPGSLPTTHSTGIHYFNETQAKFRDAINLSTKGQLPGVQDGFFRPVMRIFYGMRHASETMLKALHDAYIRYAEGLERIDTSKADAAYSMHSFFQSKAFKDSDTKLRRSLRAGEDKLLQNIEHYLCPTAVTAVIAEAPVVTTEKAKSIAPSAPELGMLSTASVNEGVATNSAAKMSFN